MMLPVLAFAAPRNGASVLVLLGATVVPAPVAKEKPVLVTVVGAAVKTGAVPWTGTIDVWVPSAVVCSATWGTVTMVETTTVVEEPGMTEPEETPVVSVQGTVTVC
jgi:hypothetical protein